MFSSEVIIKMSNGNHKSINLINPGDMIVNHLNKTVIVTKLNTFVNHLAIQVQLDNGTGVFYTTPYSLFLCRHLLSSGHHESMFCGIFDAYTDGAKLKSSCKIFSPESDVNIITYNDSDAGLTKTLYTISTLDSVNSYFINNTVVK